MGQMDHVIELLHHREPSRGPATAAGSRRRDEAVIQAEVRRLAHTLGPRRRPGRAARAAGAPAAMPVVRSAG